MSLPRRAARLVSVLLLSVPLSGPALAQGSFVNWESPHVHPLDLVPGGARLLVVNTPDDRLEVFDVSCEEPFLGASIPVGLDPVSVRARTATEAWVVNHVSDSVSVVDLTTGNVVATLDTDDEPADVVFAGSPERAFVSCSQANTVLVFDPANLAAAPTRIDIVAEEPKALCASADGSEVYVAIFESGNGTTILAGGGSGLGDPPDVVSDPQGPYGGQNPPPNSGNAFSPPIAGGLPTPPEVGLIVRQDANGDWFDDNGGDWTNLVSGAQAADSGRVPGWTLLDRDVAVIDTATLTVAYAEHLMNIGMALALNPATDHVTLVGTDATNEIRFEPNLKGTFVRVLMGEVDPSVPAAVGVHDLNPHLDYTTGTVPQGQRDLSLGDPRGVVWSGDGARAWITGMGSNNVIEVDGAGARLAAPIEVGEGPTGIALDDARSRLYVVNKFESSLSVVSTSSGNELHRVAFHDPSPAAIKLGRRHLYGTHETSGLGQTSCASCHVDARLDRLAWDLGDPSGAMIPVAGNNLGGNIPGLNTGFEDFHPMKGPMTTQTLQDIIGHEPHHWRGDRKGIEGFNGAFEGLLGDDEQLTPGEMQEFEDFLATLYFPPNPYRNFDNSLPTSLPLTGMTTSGRFGPAGAPMPNGNAVTGLALFRPPNLLDGGALACVTCHTNPVGIGTNYRLNGNLFTGTLVPLAPGPDGELHHALVSVDGSTNVSMKVPQLRNMYEKVGFDGNVTANTSGFGYLHDGSVDTLARFISEPVFNVTSEQQVANLAAFMLAFSGSDLPGGSTTPLDFEPPGTPGQDTHAAVGTQTTLVDEGTAPAAQLSLIADMLALANAGDVGVVVHGVLGGESRGFAYQGVSSFQSDRLVQTLSAAALQAAAAPGSELTYTVVPAGTETRIALDRDEDGYLDRDELDLGSDPTDAASIPGACATPLPLAATGLVTTFVGETRVDLSWGDPNAHETAWLVERRIEEEGLPFQLLDVLPPDATSYVDALAPCGKELHYRVRAETCSGLSAPACVLTTTTPCTPDYKKAPGRRRP